MMYGLFCARLLMLLIVHDEYCKAHVNSPLADDWSLLSGRVISELGRLQSLDFGDTENIGLTVAYAE